MDLYFPLEGIEQQADDPFSCFVALQLDFSFLAVTPEHLKSTYIGSSIHERMLIYY